MRSVSMFAPARLRRILLAHPAIALVLLGATAAASAQDVENGRRLAERWCAACHAIGAEPTRFNRAQPLAAIAARQGITAAMLTAFLQLPHATMPKFPLRRQDAADLAAFIMDITK